MDADVSLLEDECHTKGDILQGPQTDCKKQKGILKQVPYFLVNANTAAEAYTQALHKWENKFELSSSDTD